MKELILNRKTTCKIHFINDVFCNLARQIDVNSGAKIAIIASANIDKILIQTLANNLIAEGYRAYIYQLNDGESVKDLGNAELISAFLQQNFFSRQDMILNVGGGTICDLGAFVASVYMRGIRYVNMPTTLLCAVDACIGGKTAIDVGGSKNLWGSFYQPNEVFIDIELLHNLPADLFKEGVSEIVKYAIIDEQFGNYLTSLGDLNAIGQNLQKIVEYCIQIKSEIVCQDELDFSTRHILNAGHTVAHALECWSKFNVSHATAVAVGLKEESELSFKLGMISNERYEYIKNLLSKFTQTIEFKYNIQDLIQKMLLDKKNVNDKISFVLANEHSVAEVLLSQEQVEKLTNIK